MLICDWEDKTCKLNLSKEPVQTERGVNLKIPWEYWQKFHQRKEELGIPIKKQVREAFRQYLGIGESGITATATGSTGGPASGQTPENPRATSLGGDTTVQGGVRSLSKGLPKAFGKRSREGENDF